MNDKGLIYKGCSYHVGKEFGNKMFCEGSMCNRNQYTVDIGNYIFKFCLFDGV
jgi:hypothetical protein